MTVIYSTLQMIDHNLESKIVVMTYGAMFLSFFLLLRLNNKDFYEYDKIAKLFRKVMISTLYLGWVVLFYAYSSRPMLGFAIHEYENKPVNGFFCGISQKTLFCL